MNPYDFAIESIAQQESLNRVGGTPPFLPNNVEETPAPVVQIDENGNLKRVMLWGVGRWGVDTWG